MKKSGNFKELMIPLGFLLPTPVIMKLFYKRAAAPIIKIIPLFLQWQYLRERRNPCFMPKERVQIPGGFRCLVLIRSKRSYAAWCQVPKTQSRAGGQTPVLVYLQTLLNFSLRDLALPMWYRRATGAGVVRTPSTERGAGGPHILKLALQRAVPTYTVWETCTRLVTDRLQDDFWMLCNHASQFA